MLSAFDPARHGFRFANTFEYDLIAELGIRLSGLCGGMVYSALDFFIAGRNPPDQNYRPAVNTPLHEHLHQRQLDSVSSNLDKWAEIGINPFGGRNSEFFRWGLQGYGGGRLHELTQAIAVRNPVPLGLQEYGGGPGNHQVLAIGYNLGRYTGNLGPYQEDLRIFVYDPNFPMVRRTLVPILSEEAYVYAEAPTQRWRTYFVNRNYRPKTPPPVERLDGPTPPGSVRQILLEIRTGGDDLRGGNDNVNAIIHLRNKPPVEQRNINGGKRWIDNYSQTVAIPLPPGVALRDLSTITLATTFSGGIGGDNWNVDALKLSALVDNHLVELLSISGRPLHRFTGDSQTLTFPIPQP